MRDLSVSPATNKTTKRQRNLPAMVFKNMRYWKLDTSPFCQRCVMVDFWNNWRGEYNDAALKNNVHSYSKWAKNTDRSGQVPPECRRDVAGGAQGLWDWFENSSIQCVSTITLFYISNNNNNNKQTWFEVSHNTSRLQPVVELAPLS